jgi:hypothetical protein
MAVATLSVVVQGVGLVGPGLVSWAAAQAVLQGRAALVRAATVVPPPQRLPAAERRRAGAAVKIAMAVADAACADAGADPQTLGSVFASSSGDGANCHTLCETLASPNPADRLVSPTRFTNSVHNAPAGYWHIAVGSRAASTSLCAFDASFGAGLIAALTQVHAAREPLLLVASDTPYPEPLHTLRRLPDALGVALVLAPVAEPGHEAPRPAAGTTLRVALCPADQAPPETPCREAALEALRQQIPAARALPLLAALAAGVPATVVIAATPPLVLVIEVVPA